MTIIFRPTDNQKGMTTMTIPAPPQAAMHPNKEIERTYNVALTGDLVVPVRLRYTPGEEPAREGDQARREAIKRAVKIRAKKGDHRSFDTDTAGFTMTREALVDARPVNLGVLEQKFGKQHTHAAESAPVQRHGLNGYTQ